VLEELGFGLDLHACAATGLADDLAYVSPKSGRAVSRGAGAPWAERLLALPPFLTRRDNRAADAEALEAAFRLTGHFFNRDVYEARGIAMPEAREGFVRAALKAARREEIANEPAALDEKAVP
jgi:DNA repair protein RecO (recombination protein O)